MNRMEGSKDLRWCLKEEFHSKDLVIIDTMDSRTMYTSYKPRWVLDDIVLYVNLFGGWRG